MRSQTWLGKKLGISTNSVVNIEKGRHATSVENLLIIAKCLDGAISELCGEEPKKTLPHPQPDRNAILSEACAVLQAYTAAEPHMQKNVRVLLGIEEPGSSSMDMEDNSHT